MFPSRKGIEITRSLSREKKSPYPEELVFMPLTTIGTLLSILSLQSQRVDMGPYI